MVLEHLQLAGIKPEAEALGAPIDYDLASTLW
jgi:hypothetical protein